VIYQACEQAIIDRGDAKLPKVVFIASSGVSGPPCDDASLVYDYEAAYKAAYSDPESKNARRHNRAVVRVVQWFLSRKRRPLVLCRRVAHMRWLYRRLRKAGLTVAVSHGGVPTPMRESRYKAFSEGRYDVLLATSVMTEGEDVPAIDAIVAAEGVKSTVDALQKLGRGKRVLKDGPDDLWYVDVIPVGNPIPERHGRERLSIFTRHGYDVRVLSEWPAGDDVPPDLLPFEDWN
jgi:superfamily II DNA or RNA helicase